MPSSDNGVEDIIEVSDDSDTPPRPATHRRSLFRRDRRGGMCGGQVPRMYLGTPMSDLPESSPAPAPSQVSGAGPFPAPSTARAAAERLSIGSAQRGNAGPVQGSPPASNAVADVVRAVEGLRQGVTARLDGMAQSIDTNTRDFQELRRVHGASLQGIIEVGQTLANHAQMFRDVQADMNNLYAGFPLSAQPPSPSPERERCIVTVWVSPEMRERIRGFEDF